MSRKKGIYEKYVKRALDIICSLFVIILFWWLYLIIAIMVRIKLGRPIIFTQLRPGMISERTGQETIFKMYKFRSMTDEKDINGNLISDEKCLTKFGAWLRSTSLDEYDIIGQTRKTLENRGFREVSPINFLDNHTRFGWYSCDMRIATV